MNIKINIQKITQNLPSGCQLVAVSKTKSAALIQEAYDAGQRHFGENKVQELVPKFETLPKDICWHMIGHLQSNKVKYIAPFVYLIHSIDSERLLAEVNKQAAKSNRVIPCLLQVHIAKEETKFGFSTDEVKAFIKSSNIATYDHVRISGLMGMATLTDDENQVREEFRTLRLAFYDLRNSTLPANAAMEILSMGMSGDYSLAVAEGSTMVRVGSALFGDRS
ncbi:YggS family pyridoxal phosphate-dependent enzyme [Chryseolinea sp. T2]|uniref:YggS family pyridoxal phosphate-dependent enzyme n=1 Tax=Chryseolinea sp. T2 TaxID=3129255 RepID=UPI003077728D